jgi:CheY-like chemotaxis protein
MVLRNEGASVTAAGSVKAALAAIENARPNIILSDIAMPGEDGFALLERIRGMERSSGEPHIPVIALTAYAREEDRKRALDAGFDTHLSKPIEPEKLISVIKELATRPPKAA